MFVLTIETIGKGMYSNNRFFLFEIPRTLVSPQYLDLLSFPFLCNFKNASFCLSILRRCVQPAVFESSGIARDKSILKGRIKSFSSFLEEENHGKLV